MDKSLRELLIEYSKEDYYPFHMPGHKRSKAIDYIPVETDITEIDGFDNLHHAEGILLQAQERAARLYGADESFFLVNGSTSGILTAISAICAPGETLLMARNSHKAAYHGVFLNELSVEYIYPQIMKKCGICGGINPKDVEKHLKQNAEIRAVYVTSPTYEGMVSNIAEIADIVHEFGKILIVDEAHGAHFGIGGKDFPQSAVSHGAHFGIGGKDFPQSAVAHGADIVIQSTHKTLPSMTQTAILHVKGERVNRRRLRKYLQIYQTSSPSYVMMAGLDSCYRMMERDAEKLFSAYRQLLDGFYDEAESLKQIHVVIPWKMAGRCAIQEMDPSKICIVTKDAGVTGAQLYRILLEKYHIQPEMAAGDYVLAMTSVMDTKEGFVRLIKALKEIDDALSTDKSRFTLAGDLGGILENRQKDKQKLKEGVAISWETALPGINCPAKVKMTAGEADFASQEAVLFEKSVGRISAEYRYIYPPGVPILVPGEEITYEIVELLKKYAAMGLTVLGQELSEKEIFVIVEKTNF